jgi:hypothetical protein
MIVVSFAAPASMIDVRPAVPLHDRCVSPYLKSHNDHQSRAALVGALTGCSSRRDAMIPA